LTISAHHVVDTLRRCWTRAWVSRRGFGFPAGDGALLGSGVQGDLRAVAGYAEMGVLDVDGDDLPGVGGSDA
jgi:hypothetical protein